MKEELITLEIAKIAKEKGFNIPVYAKYVDLNSMYSSQYSPSKLIERNLNKVSFSLNEAQILIHKDEERNPHNYGGDSQEYYSRKVEYKNFLWANKSGGCFDYWYAAPTQSLLQKWLREVHKINIAVEYVGFDEYGNKQLFNILIHPMTDYVQNLPWGSMKRFSNEGKYFNTYEGALEQGLLQALKQITI